MSKSSKKVKKAKLSGHSRGPRSDWKIFWTQRIEPKRTAFISENLMPVLFVIKNRGPAPVFLVAEHGKQMDVGPDAGARHLRLGESLGRETGTKNRLP